MTEVKPWQVAINPAFLQRLLRPSVQPGCIDRHLSQAIISRYQRLTERLPLLSQLLQRQNNLTGFQTDSLPIVYAQPVPPQAGSVIRTNVLVQTDQHQQTIEQNQVINQSYKESSSIQLANNQIHRPILNNLTDIDLIRISQSSVNQTNVNPVRENQLQDNPTPIEQLRPTIIPANAPVNIPANIQTKLTDSASVPTLPALSADGRPSDVPAVVTNEQPLPTVTPLQVEWLRSPNGPQANAADMRSDAALNRSNASLTQRPIVVAQPWARSDAETAQNTPPFVVQVPVTPALRSGSFNADLPLVTETGGRSSSSPISSVSLPIVQVSPGGELPGQPGSSGSSGTGAANRGGIAHPLIFSVPSARATTPQGGMEHFMASSPGSNAGRHPSLPPARADMANRSHNVPPIGNGQVAHSLPIQSDAMTTEQAKRLIVDQTKRLVDVEALTDKIERQLMRRLSVEHERRGWAR